MGVEVLGVPNEGNGYGDTMDAFRDAHLANSRVLLNLANGRKKNAATPPYDPAHADNRWPTMVYSATFGEKTIGVSLVGLKDSVRAEALKANEAALADAIAAGYRRKPYEKPQVAVLDPAAEKKALLDKNQELEGKIVAQGDSFAKLQAQFEDLKKSLAPQAAAMPAETPAPPVKDPKPAK